MVTTTPGSTDTPLSLSPGALATPSMSGGRPFLLSASEWFAIQIYVANAITLPVDDASFKTSLGAGAPDSMSDFEPLIACYKGINAHCTTWQNTIFPATVSLASDIHQYGAAKAPTFYAAILTEANVLINDPTNANAQAALKAILDNLSETATRYQQQAAAVSQQIQSFATDSAADRVALIGVNGDAGLVKYYDDKYGAQSAEVKQMQDDIAAQQVICDAAMDEYHHDVTIAATTPTYAWIPFYGWIAGAVVAGMYGQKAVEALHRANDAKAQEDNDSAIIARDRRLMEAIRLAEHSMADIAGKLSAALPIIQKIEGVWGAIASDIAAITTLIDTDIRRALPVLMSLGVSEAIESWANVADEADTYRVNAYVTLTGAASGTATIH